MEDKFENLASHINLLYDARNNMCKHYGQEQIKYSANTDDGSLHNSFKFDITKRDIFIWFNPECEITQEMSDFDYNVGNGFKFLTPYQIGMPNSDQYKEMHFAISIKDSEIGELLNFSTDGEKLTAKNRVACETLHKYYQSKLEKIDNVYEAIDLAFDILLS